MRLRRRYLAIFMITMGWLCVCEQENSRAEELLLTVQREISIGMQRSEVERRLREIDGIYWVYVSRDHIEPPSERRFGDTVLGGRLTVSSPMQIERAAKSSAHAVVEFDESDRVVNVRFGGFGIGDAPK